MNAASSARATHRIASETIVFRGFASMILTEVERAPPDGTTARYKRLVETHGSAAAVLAYDPARRVAVLVRQFRAAVALSGRDGLVTEAIAGLLDKDGEDGEATARREAMEEAGLQLGEIEALPVLASMPGISTEHMHLFLAAVDIDVARIAEGGGAADEDEDIEVLVVPLAELAAMLRDGTLVDMKTVVLTQALMLRRPELFRP